MKKELHVLCLVGALEKFSYNGIRALLIIYLSRQLAFTDEKSFATYSALSALGFLTPLLGGWIADRFLGIRTSATLGGLFAGAGLFALMWPTSVPFHTGLGLLILGCGFIKSNVPILLAKLNEATGTARDAAFTLMYMGFNVGTFFGTLVCALVGETLGWHWAFFVAGLAMLACAALVYRATLSISEPTRPVALAIIVSLVVASGFGWAISKPELLTYLIPVLSAFSIAALITFGVRSRGAVLQSVLKILALMLFHTLFYALYEQGGLSLALFAERNIDRSLYALIGIDRVVLFGLTINKIPTTFFQTIDPFLNVIIALVMARAFSSTQKNRMSVSVSAKFAFGLVALALGFGLLHFGALASRSGLVSPWLLIGSYAIFVLGELCTIPVGLSMVSAEAPARHKGFFMGIWFLSIGWSAWLAGSLSSLTKSAGTQKHISQSLEVYADAFRSYGLIAATGAVLLLIGARLVRTSINYAQPTSHPQTNR